MFTVLIGRANSGKSERILRRICDLGDSSKQILLVPEHASHAAETELCRICGDTASRHAEVLTFKLLASRVLTLTGGISDYTLDAGGKLLSVQRALMETQTKLRVYRRPSQRTAFLEGMVSLFDEFDACGVTSEVIAACGEGVGGAQGDKLCDLALVYGVYRARLHNETTDARDRVTKLGEKLAESGYIDGKDVFLDGFSYFTAQEEKVLAILLRRARSVTVSLLGQKEADSSGVFLLSRRVREDMARLAAECGRECEIVYLPGQKKDSALAHIERTFFEEPKVWNGETQEICLYRADTMLSELEWVASEILRLVRSGKYRFRDIGVTTRHLEAYEAAAEGVFGRCGVPVFRSRRSSVLDKPVLALLTGALEAVSGGFAYEDMFRYLKTGLAGITIEECDELENYVLCWDIRGNMWLREEGWNAHPRGYGVAWDEGDHAALARVNALRERIRVPLCALRDGLREGAAVRKKAETLYRFLLQIGLPEVLRARTQTLHEAGEAEHAEELAQLWQILCGVLDQLVEIMGDLAMETEEFARLVRLVLTQYSIGSIPVSLDQVSLSEMTRNDSHPIKCLFIVGADERNIPDADTASGILTEEDRDALGAFRVRLAPYGDEQFSMEWQNLYASLAQPSERLYVTYCASDASGAEVRPSFVQTRLRALCPRLRDEAEGEDKAFRCASVLGALEAAGGAIGGELWSYFSAHEEYASRLALMERAAKLVRGRLSSAAVRELYGERFYLSASKLDAARRCHFSYFMQYGLRAKKRPSADFDAPQIGTFIHYILENVTREVYERGGFDKVDAAQRGELIETYVARYIENELGNFRDKTARFRYLFNRLKTTARSIVEDLCAELSESDFRPLSYELKFGSGGEMDAISFSRKGAQMYLSGAVDRVDGWVHEGKLYLRVVDYKTGKKKFDLSEIRYGLGLQMLLYLFTLEKEGSAYYGQEIVPAGVLYVPARDPILAASRNATEQELRRAMEKELRRSGMLLGEPTVLRAMEHSALDEPHYLPIRVNRSGDISGSIADAAQLGKLGKYTETLLQKMFDELRGGNIDADPCWHSPEDNACAHCLYADACHFEEGRGNDRTEVIRATTQAEFWEHIDKEGREDEGDGCGATDE